MAQDQRFLFTGSDDMTIVIWDLFNKYVVGKLEGHKESITDLLFIERTGILLSCGYDKMIRAWKYQKN